MLFLICVEFGALILSVRFLAYERRQHAFSYAFSRQVLPSDHCTKVKHFQDNRRISNFIHMVSIYLYQDTQLKLESRW